jgi:hypothetical protein
MNNDTTIKSLEVLRDDFYKKYKSIDDTINLLRGVSNGNNNAAPLLTMSTDGYDKAWAMKLKMSHALKKAGRFLHIREIAEILHQYEPEITEKEFIGKLYPAIAELKKSNTIVKFSVDSTNFNTFWGSKNWLDGTGKIKEGYEFDKKQIRNNKSDVIEI